MDGTKKRNARLIMNSGLKLNFIQFFSMGLEMTFVAGAVLFREFTFYEINSIGFARIYISTAPLQANEREAAKEFISSFH